MLSVYNQYVRGLDSKVDFFSIVGSSDYETISLSEIWFRPEVNSYIIFSSNYEVYSRNRKRLQAGLTTVSGVLLVIYKNIPSELVESTYFE